MTGLRTGSAMVAGPVMAMALVGPLMSSNVAVLVAAGGVLGLIVYLLGFVVIVLGVLLIAASLIQSLWQRFKRRQDRA